MCIQNFCVGAFILAERYHYVILRKIEKNDCSKKENQHIEYWIVKGVSLLMTFQPHLYLQGSKLGVMGDQGSCGSLKFLQGAQI